MRSILRIGGLLAFTLAAVLPARAQNLAEFEKKVTEFTLPNGLHFIIIKRDVAPIASFNTFAKVGGADEPFGQSGIAHIFEHMVFKGTTTVGTTDAAKEQEALARLDEAYLAWHLAKRNGANEETLKPLWENFKAIETEAKQYVVNNEFSTIVDKAGAQGLNASTSSDETQYYYSLPSNKAELWFALEADRFKNPVLREFYTEKDVVYEERRMRTESNPIGRMIEEFLAVAYTSHHYGIPVIGWPSDIQAVTMADAKAFFAKYYVPSNFCVAISGNVDPAEMKRLAEKYFGDIPYSKPALPTLTDELPQRGERRFVVEDASQPLYLEGYHAVSNYHPDRFALDLLGQILSTGRTSRMYKRMVEDEKVALAAGAFNGFPGVRYPGLMLIFCLPNQGVELSKIESIIREEIGKAQAGDITQAELDRVRTNQRVNVIRSLDDNSGIAGQFARARMIDGDWRSVFTDLDKYDQVTLDDLKRVANQYLVKQNRTVGMIQNNAK